MSKKDRQKTILEVIDGYEIDTQEELTAKLIEMGLKVSQATVSRDINQLNLIKVPGKEKKTRYSINKPVDTKIPQKIIDLFKQVSLSCVAVNNLIVLKTLSGNAGTAGMAIDEMHFSQVLGTIAGDDTLLIITKSNSDAETVMRKIRSV